MVLLLPNSDWLAQPTWYVDEISGNDDNDGATTGTALKTLYEYVNRIGTGTVTVPIQTLNILTDITTVETAPIVFQGTYARLNIKGTRTIERSGTITGLQVWNAATDQDGQITDTSVATWVPDVGRMIELTSGSNIGASGWVALDTGAGSDTCRYSAFFDADAFDPIDPGGTDTYDVVTLPTITGHVLLNINGFCTVMDVHFTNTGFLTAIRFKSGQYSVIFCQFSGQFGSRVSGELESQFGLQGCFIETDLDGHFGLTFYTCCLLTAQQFLRRGCHLAITDCLWQGIRAMRLDGGASFQVFSNRFLAVWDIPGATACITLRSGAKGEVAGRCIGTAAGASAIGLQVDSFANIVYLGDAVDRFGFTGTTFIDANLAGDSTITYAGLGTTGSQGTNAIRNASIVPGTLPS